MSNDAAHETRTATEWLRRIELLNSKRPRYCGIPPTQYAYLIELAAAEASQG